MRQTTEVMTRSDLDEAIELNERAINERDGSEPDAIRDAALAIARKLTDDQRAILVAMLRAGKSSEEVKAFMVARYGDFVLYRPQFQTNTYLLWLGPFVLLLIALVLFVRRLRASAAPVEVDARALSEARELLEKDESRS